MPYTTRAPLLIAFVFTSYILLSGSATLISGTTDTLSFQSDPSGAMVYLDGQPIGTTPMSLSVKKKPGQIIYG